MGRGREGGREGGRGGGREGGRKEWTEVEGEGGREEWTEGYRQLDSPFNTFH